MWQNASVTNILAVQGTRNTFFHLAYPFVSQLLKDVLQQTESNMMMKCAVPATQCVYVLCVCVSCLRAWTDSREIAPALIEGRQRQEGSVGSKMLSKLSFDFRDFSMTLS